MRKLLLVCVAALVLLTQLSLAQKKGKSSAEEAVGAADAQFGKAVAAKDLEASLRFYADDAIVLEPGMPALKDKQAIRKLFQDLFAYKDLDFGWTTEAAEVSKSGDLAYTRGTFHFKYTDASGKPVNDQGKYATVWKKIGGEWKAIVDINNSNGEAAAEGK